MSDWKDIMEGAGDLNISRRTLTIPHPYKKSHAIKWLKESIKKWDSKKAYAFLIELKEERKIIGTIGLMHINLDSRTAETGSWINKKYQKKGYITEAKIAANNFAFNKLKLRKLNSSVFSDNKASNNVQRKVGYKLEGIRKKHLITSLTKEIKDENLYGLFKEDWKKKLPKLKKKLNKKIKQK